MSYFQTGYQQCERHAKTAELHIIPDRGINRPNLSLSHGIASTVFWVNFFHKDVGLPRFLLQEGVRPGGRAPASVNFLAHALLAGSEADNRLGAILGDFVKGALPGAFPSALAAGIELHRRIDSFADAHPAFRRSRARVTPERRRYAGIMVDMFYDHFLARHWHNFNQQPLEEFSAELYELWCDGAHAISPQLDEMLPLMKSQDWLASYRSLDAIESALDRMAVRRLKRANMLAGSGVELKARYLEFEQDFQAFFPEAQAYASALRRRYRQQLAAGTA